MKMDCYPPNPLNHIGDRITRQVYAQPGADSRQEAYTRLVTCVKGGKNETRWPMYIINRFFQHVNLDELKVAKPNAAIDSEMNVDTESPGERKEKLEQFLDSIKDVAVPNKS